LSKALKKNTYKCEFCFKLFVREHSFINHLCKYKKRWLSRKQSDVLLGFEVWDKFYKLNYVFSNSKKRTYKDFMKSNYYIDFVKFGSYLLKLDPIDRTEFIIFVCSGYAKLKDWSKPFVYNAFICQYLEKESINNAVERSILSIQKWCIKEEIKLSEFIEKVPPNSIILMVQLGRISPWFLFCTSILLHLEKIMTDEQKLLLYDAIGNIKKWRYKVKKNSEDVKYIKNILKRLGF